MKKIFAIAWKDAIVRFSSSSELLFFIILPIVFTFLLAGGTPSGDEDPRISFLLVDEAKTAISQQIIDQLENSTAVRPELTTRQEAQNLFDDRRAEVVLIIPAGIDSASLQNGSAEVELLQRPNNMNATVAERAILTAIRRVSSSVSAAQNAVKQRESIQPFASEAEKQIYFENSLETAQSIQNDAPERVTVVQGNTEDQVDYDPRANSSAGQLLVQMLLLVGFGILVMKLNWGREPLALFVILLTSALAAAAFGTTMGTFIKSEGQANGLSIMFGMVFALMGGCWYPLEMFPSTIQNIVKVLPTTWAMQGMLDLVLRGGGLRDILPEAGVLLGFAVIFFSVGVWRFRYE